MRALAKVPTDRHASAGEFRDEETGYHLIRMSRYSRLIASAIADRACSAPALQARLSEQVAAFAGDTLHDDATLIVVAVE